MNINRDSLLAKTTLGISSGFGRVVAIIQRENLLHTTFKVYISAGY